MQYTTKSTVEDLLINRAVEVELFYEDTSWPSIIVEGKVRMNGKVYEKDAILEIPPGEATDFEALTDVVTTVVKVPAVEGDKYEC